MTNQIEVGKRIVQSLRYQGFIVELIEGRIRYSQGRMPPDSDRDEIRANRDAVVAYLASEPARRERSCFGECLRCRSYDWRTGQPLTCIRCGYEAPKFFP
jgi:hypothetical protein